MYAATDDYFRSGQRVCLVGVVALGASRDLFSEKVKVYFAGWVDALAAALRRHGNEEERRPPQGRHAVLEIQGALVLGARLRRREGVFEVAQGIGAQAARKIAAMRGDASPRQVAVQRVIAAALWRAISAL